MDIQKKNKNHHSILSNSNDNASGLLVSIVNNTQTVRNEIVASKGMDVWDESYFEKQ